MTTSLDKILGYVSLDLSTFEMRGAKSGVNNARTTGPVYVDGTYSYPFKSIVTGYGTFVNDSSIVGNFHFNPPYDGSNAFMLYPGDNLTAHSLPLQIKKIKDTTSFELVDAVSFDAVADPISFNLIERDYIVEPDEDNNTKTGTAFFTTGSKNVHGSGFSNLAAGDFIRTDNYLQYYRIATVSDPNLTLVAPYDGSSTPPTPISGEPYVAKRWVAGRAELRYSRDNVTYDSQSAKWKYAAITKDGLPSSTDFTDLSDGIELKFTHSLNSNAPDIMDVNSVVDKIFSKATQYDTFQYSFPVVPHPETLTLKINNAVKDLYPKGNQDYVLNYTNNPLYTPPPPPDHRNVANFMPIRGPQYVTYRNGGKGFIRPPTKDTQSGQFQAVDASGNSITGIMQGTEIIALGDKTQVLYKNYALEPYSGMVELTETVINEPVVKYVGVNYNSSIDYGLEIYLNGEKQKITFPPSSSDDVIFQPDFGRFKPRSQDHPGPDDIYEIHYMVDSGASQTDTIQVDAGQTVINTRLFPIKQYTLFLAKDGGYLDEGDDYVVSYLSGKITLLSAPTVKTNYTVNYNVLSKQVNDITYSDGVSFCTVHDSRMSVINADTYQFQMANTLFDLGNMNMTILRIYNESRNRDYDIANYVGEGSTINLALTAANLAVGLSTSDVVVVDYTYPSDTVEYVPVSINYLEIKSGATAMYLEGVDLTPTVVPGAVLNLDLPNTSTQFFNVVDSISYDGFGTKIILKTPVTQDIVNPNLNISDSSVSFFASPVSAGPIISGSSKIPFLKKNISNIFRPGTLINVQNQIYVATGATFDGTDTQVSLTSQVITDCTNSGYLSSVTYSETPIYNEGATVIVPALPAITLTGQPALHLSVVNNSNSIYDIASDTFALSIDSTAFNYGNLTVASLALAIDSSGIPDLHVATDASSWKANKIRPVTALTTYTGYDTVLYADYNLRHSTNSITYVDNTNFSINSSGAVELKDPIKRYDRYNMDYLGRRFIDTTQVTYTFKYFTSLPAKSKVQASFEFDNLDQFYIQVLDRRQFFNDVTIPRMKDEAYQLNGNVGQGGEVSGDEGSGPSSGGISGDEYRRQDAEIECRVFEDIYDFFQKRLDSYGTEILSITGLKMFNNDGTFSDDQQIGANKTVSRIFPNMRYTSYEPMQVNPLTGYYTSNGAVFTNNSQEITGVGNQLWTQKLKTGDFITRADSTVKYKIASVVNDSSIVLEQPFVAPPSRRKYPKKLKPQYRALYDSYYARKLPYLASTGFPLYDDDGYLGPKAVGELDDDFGLSSGDMFKCSMTRSDGIVWSGSGSDTTISKYIFMDPGLPYSLFTTSVSKLSASDIAQRLSSNMPGLIVRAETVVDPEEPYGYRTALVLRADSIAKVNVLSLSEGDAPYGDAMSKLGFSPDSTYVGNWDRTAYSPEFVWDLWELTPDKDESTALLAMLPPGNTNKLLRSISPLYADFSSALTRELSYLYQEVDSLNTQIDALSVITSEPGISSSYAHATDACNNALTARTNALNAISNNLYILQDPSDGTWVWPINKASVDPDEFYFDGTDSFVLTTYVGDDARILNTPAISFISQLSTDPFIPPVVNQDSSNQGGTWTGWDSSVSNAYSLKNDATFTIAPTPLFVIRNDNTDYITDIYYTVSPTGLKIDWTNIDSSSFHNEYLYNDFYQVKDMTAAINLDSSGVMAVHGAQYKDVPNQYFVNSEGWAYPTDATIYKGLGSLYVSYSTISDRNVNDRLPVVYDRTGYLWHTRLPYLSSRENTVKGDILDEGLLRTSTGDPGDIYAWANNRFNRRQGCYAKLKQIEQIMASNQAAISINKSLI